MTNQQVSTEISPVEKWKARKQYLDSLSRDELAANEKVRGELVIHTFHEAMSQLERKGVSVKDTNVTLCHDWMTIAFGVNNKGREKFNALAQTLGSRLMTE